MADLVYPVATYQPSPLPILLLYKGDPHNTLSPAQTGPARGARTRNAAAGPALRRVRVGSCEAGYQNKARPPL